MKSIGDAQDGEFINDNRVLTLYINYVYSSSTYAYVLT